jgi:hypothetical protein
VIAGSPLVDDNEKGKDENDKGRHSWRPLLFVLARSASAGRST